MKKKNGMGFGSGLEESSIYETLKDNYVKLESANGQSNYIGKLTGLIEGEYVLNPYLDRDCSNGKPIMKLIDRERFVSSHMIGAKNIITIEEIRGICNLNNFPKESQ